MNPDAREKYVLVVFLATEEDNCVQEITQCDLAAVQWVCLK